MFSGSRRANATIDNFIIHAEATLIRTNVSVRLCEGCAPRSWLGALVGVGDRLERRLDERDLAVRREIEARDIDRLAYPIEGDVLGEQSRDLRIEAGDFDPHRDRIAPLASSRSE